MTWRHVAHTADVGIEVEAGTREELFSAAAEALTALLVEPAEGGADAGGGPGKAPEGADAGAGSAAAPVTHGGAAVEVPVRLPPADDASLLRDWLAEVLVAFDVNGVVGRGFPVALGPDGLRGAVVGERFDPERHRLGLEVKAVTYHDLEVEETPGGWRARVLLDV